LVESDDTVYEHLASASTLHFPDNVGLAVTEDQELIGRWGEQLVKRYLEKCREDPVSRIVDIVWCDETRQTGLPYDFVIQKSSENGEVNDVKINIK